MVSQSLKFVFCVFLHMSISSRFTQWSVRQAILPVSFPHTSRKNEHNRNWLQATFTSDLLLFIPGLGYAPLLPIHCFSAWICQKKNSEKEKFSSRAQQTGNTLHLFQISTQRPIQFQSVWKRFKVPIRIKSSFIFKKKI